MLNNPRRKYIQAAAVVAILALLAGLSGCPNVMVLHDRIEESRDASGGGGGLSDDKAITDFRFEADLHDALSSDGIGEIDEGEKTISVTVPHGTNVTNLEPTITHTGVSISPSSEEPQSFSENVTYTVTAEDGSTTNYVVTVLIATDLKAIIEFTFTDPPAFGVIDEGEKTIAVMVPHRTDLTKNIVPTIVHTGQSITPESGVARNFSSPVIYTVTAVDESTVGYTVTVTVAPANSKEITSFRIGAENDGVEATVEGDINEANKTIIVRVPFGTPMNPLVPTITITGASISPASGVAGNFSSSVTYTVTAADESTVDYTVTVHEENAVITFDADGGEPGMRIVEVIPPNDTVSAFPDNPVREGYTFDSWNTERDGAGQEFTNTTVVTGNMTVYAYWRANTYTVTLAAGNGTGGTPSVEATFDSPMPTGGDVTAPTFTGYTFGGYYVAVGDEATQYYNASMNSVRNWNIAEATTLHAKWQVIDYSITYHLDGGSIDSGTNPDTYTIETYTITLAAPTYTGYTFSGWYDNDGFAGEPVVQIQQGSTGDKTFYAHWTVDDNTFSGGDGTANNPYQIARAGQLGLVRGYLGEEHKNKHFKLTQNIELDNEWVPIGGNGNYDQSNRFMGSFDGGGFTITGLTIDTGNQYVGMFGVVYQAELKNIHLRDVNINGTGNYVGGLVGLVGGESTEKTTTITNCSVTGNITGAQYIGGLVGSGGRPTGLRGNDIIIEECWTNVAITGTWYAGGLIGDIFFDLELNRTCRIKRSFAQGTVTGTGNAAFLGGLVGYAYQTTIEDSYATGAVSGETRLGGLVGMYSQAADLTIERCYSTGKVTGTDSYNGAFIGLFSNGSNDNLEYNYYDDGVNGGLPGIGSGLSSPQVSSLAGKNTEQMMQGSTFQSGQPWDFHLTWEINENASYPYLKWQNDENVPTPPVYDIGDEGPAGGIVFYDKGAYSHGWRYMEVWTADEVEQSTYQWKTDTTDTPGTAIAIGTGYSNTYDAMAMAGVEHPAAAVARAATHGGYYDWVLPSKDELWEIWWNLVSDQSNENDGRGEPKPDAVGGFASDYYWSSSGSATHFAWVQYFLHGTQVARSKTDTYGVRVVRAF